MYISKCHPKHPKQFFKKTWICRKTCVLFPTTCLKNHFSGLHLQTTSLAYIYPQVSAIELGVNLAVYTTAHFH